MFLLVNTDGGVIDNTVSPPGLASAAYVMRDEDGLAASKSETFNGTNNDAEYHGVLLALEDLKTMDAEGAQIRCDSELIVGQVTGRYRCKDDRMKAYRAKVIALLEEIPFPVHFKIIKRKANSEADWLCTHALYRGPKTDLLSEMPARVSRDKLKGLTA